ncbi:MAG: hypothetical protein WD942_01910 [Dehalococcoidia bacterium]
MPAERQSNSPPGIDPREVSSRDALAIVAESLGVPYQDSFPGSCWEAVIAQSIRRTSSVIGPLPKRGLTDSVHRALSALYVADDLRDRVNDAVDDLAQQSELVTDEAASDGNRTTVYRLIGPRVVLHDSGIGVVQGEGPDGQSILPDELRQSLHWRGGTRLLLVSDESQAILRSLGFFFQDFEVWVKEPGFESASQVVEHFKPEASDPRDIEGLTVIDPNAQVSYYRGRWRELRSTDDGLMVGRRSWDYGDGWWCVVLTRGGTVVGHQDLHPSKLTTSADQAWLVQCAIDHLNATPQLYSISESGGTASGGALSIYSPVPSWISRRWTVLGESVKPARGALATWRFLDAETLHIEAEHLRKTLWLEPITEAGVDQT